MNRRTFAQTLATGTAGLGLRPDGASATSPALLELPASPLDQQQDNMMQVMTRFVDDLAQGDAKRREAIAPSRPRQIAMVAYPGMFPLDLLGPHTVFSDLLNTQIHLVWKAKQQVAAGRGVVLNVTPFTDCPKDLDVLFVPGGTVGTTAAMQDPEVLDFLRSRASTTRYITSVCTGSLVLGAAGLLEGYRATSHWLTHDLLSRFGATPVKARVVEDRNRITGAGVTAGLDFALVLVARLAGENYARAETLNLEYDPAPPYKAGTPTSAGPLVAGAMSRMYASSLKAFEQVASVRR
jgi:cyclohexyl-isocyanide hydratase